MFRFNRRYKCCRVNKRTFILTVCLLVTCLPIWWILSEKEIALGDGTLDISDYVFDEPDLTEDFPVTDEKTYHTLSRIPKIIHQTWKDHHVPSSFHDNVHSFVELNPDYEYMYWTDKSARRLIVERHPDLLETFDNYAEPVRRADMLRYVVLHEFGGVYADLDTKCLRRLDRVLNKYSCVLSPEPFEHSTLVYNTEFLVTNSIMFCQAFHPFLKTLMYNLPSFSHFSQDIDASGPNYLTYHLNQYLKNIESRDIPDAHAHSIFIPSSRYFQNEIDPVRFEQFRRMCRNFENLNSIARKGCVSLFRRGMVYRKQNLFTFTKHSFYHTGYKILPESETNITQLVEHAKIYSKSIP